MLNLQLGDKKKDVALLQQILGLKPTGEFDQQLKNAVIEVQKNNNIFWPDGYVDYRVWNALCKVDKAVSFRPMFHNFTKAKKVGVKYIVLLYNNSYQCSFRAESFRSNMACNNNSTDFIIGEYVIQCNPFIPLFHAWAIQEPFINNVLVRNFNSISIAVCQDSNDNEYNSWLYQKVDEFVLFLRKKFNIPTCQTYHIGGDYRRNRL